MATSNFPLRGPKAAVLCFKGRVNMAALRLRAAVNMAAPHRDSVDTKSAPTPPLDPARVAVSRRTGITSLTKKDFSRQNYEMECDEAGTQKTISEVKKTGGALGPQTPASKPTAEAPTPGCHGFGDIKKNIIRASKMPPLPRDETKIVVRPRGGLCISKRPYGRRQDSIREEETRTRCALIHYKASWSVSTPSQENVKHYVNVEAITVAGQDHEVSAYVAAPHATCKGIIRGIPLSDGPEAIERKIVNARNPLALGAKRIKSTGVVIELFDGYKVPNYVSYGGTLIKRRRDLRARAIQARSPSFDVDASIELNGCHHQDQPGPSATGGRSRSRGRSKTGGGSKSRSTSRARQKSRSRSGARSMSRTRSGSRARSGSSSIPDQGKADAAGTCPDTSPSQATICLGAPAIDGSPAERGPGQEKIKPHWADRVRSSDGEQPCNATRPQSMLGTRMYRD
ncbi:hypothetical protein HPB52_020026 [Rhipicephalus sanguineus]|uniref:Uncharacterized protein n=1 Tax=Rhipicephalus sanguineus TaxID=34632 RepID=A0A9D4PP93_RHISA|nr:hypothetical protein HPB52_020026 [Rhipicephalus sanguineus]